MMPLAHPNRPAWAVGCVVPFSHPTFLPVTELSHFSACARRPIRANYPSDPGGFLAKELARRQAAVQGCGPDDERGR